MRDRLKGLRQVDGKKGSSADLLVENLAKEAKNSGFLLRERAKSLVVDKTQKVPGKEFSIRLISRNTGQLT